MFFFAVLIGVISTIILQAQDGQRNENYAKIISLIQQNYVDPTRLDPTKMLLNAIVNASKEIPEVFIVEQKTDDQQVTVLLQVNKKQLEVTLRKDEDLDSLAEALNFVENFIKQNLINSDLSNEIQLSLANGFLSSLDPHSDFFSQQDFDNFNQTSKGSFGGVGIFIEMLDNRVRVVSPIADSPAERAGLQARDTIDKVDGVPAFGLDLNKVVDMIKGKIGTYVTLTISRVGWDTGRDFKIQRGKIFNTMDYYVSEEENGNIGYVRFRRFSKEATNNMIFALNKINVNSPDFKGLIVDLRNNPGGFLDQAIAVTNIFLDEGMIVAIGKKKDKIKQVYNSDASETHYNKPLILLINQNSASASEIMAAALKYNNRALVLGNTTFGKGSVQTIYNIPKGTGLKLTIAQYFTPNFKSIQSVGVSPHIDFQIINPQPKRFSFLNEFNFFKENKFENAFEWGDEDIVDPLATVVNVFFQRERNPDNSKYSNGINLTDLSHDSIFQFAKNILVSSPPSTGIDGLIELSQEKVNQFNIKEQHFFSEELQKQGIEWVNLDEEIEPVSSIEIGVDYYMLKKNGENESKKPVKSDYIFKQGETGVLSVSLTNNGETDLNNIIAQSNSTDRRLNNKELPFGLLKKGDSIVRELRFETKVNELNSIIPVSFNYYASKSKIGKSVEYQVNVKGVDSPAYSLSAKLTPHWENDLFVGGEIKASIQNLSNTTSGSPFVRFSTPYNSGVSMEKFLFKAGELAPNDITSDVLIFKMEKPTREISSDFNFNLFDSSFDFIALSKEIKFDATNLNFLESPVIIALDQIPTFTESEEIQVKGNLTDDQQVKYYYIFVNSDKKMFSIADNDDQAEFEKFSYSVPLERGKNNLIQLVAEDDHGNISMKQTWIWSGEIKIAETGNR